MTQKGNLPGFASASTSIAAPSVAIAFAAVSSASFLNAVNHRQIFDVGVNSVHNTINTPGPSPVNAAFMSYYRPAVHSYGQTTLLTPSSEAVSRAEGSLINNAPLSCRKCGKIFKQTQMKPRLPVMRKVLPWVSILYSISPVNDTNK